MCHGKWQIFFADYGRLARPAEDAPAEIAGFVWLTRKRVLTPKAFEDELYALQIRAELRQMYQQETASVA